MRQQKKEEAVRQGDEIPTHIIYRSYTVCSFATVFSSDRVGDPNISSIVS